MFVKSRNEGNAFDDEKEWKIYWKGFDDRDKEGIIVSVFENFFLLFPLLSILVFPRKQREMKRKREKIYRVDTWKNEKKFHEAVTLHVFYNSFEFFLFFVFRFYLFTTRHNRMASYAHSLLWCLFH